MNDNLKKKPKHSLPRADQYGRAFFMFVQHFLFILETITLSGIWYSSIEFKVNVLFKSYLNIPIK